MDCEEGPSKAKQRKSVFSLIYSDTEDELFCDSNSESSYEEGSSSDDEVLSDLRNYTTPKSTAWNTKANMKDIPFTKENNFTGQPTGSNPIDYFNFFFEESFLEMICTHTNKQAERLFLSEKTKPRSRITSWKELTVPELRVFLGLMFHMGTISLNRLYDYWKKDRLFSLTIFSEQMSRNRFVIILQCLYFAAEAKTDDPLDKIRAVIDYFNNKMDSCYYPGKELCLDECMILRQGHFSIRQFFKSKRYKYGIKLFMLTEPDGIILKYKVEAGSIYTEVTAQGHAERIVMDLIQEKLNNGHSIYMTKYYNSIPLARRLLDNNTYCTGLLRKDFKENPREVINAMLKERENISRFSEHIHIGKWRDKRNVTYITTEFPNKLVSVPTKRGLISRKPEAIAKYNNYMSSADRNDKLFSFYPFERKMIRWHIKVVIHTFQLLLVNSYKIYNKYSGNPKLRLYDYRLAVIDALLPHKTNMQPVPKKLPGHKICRITEKSKGRIKRKLCRMCYKRKHRKDTIWHCPGCPSRPGLCVECFDSYHAEL